MYGISWSGYYDPSYTRPVYIFGDVRRGGNSVDVMTGEIREE